MAKQKATKAIPAVATVSDQAAPEPSPPRGPYRPIGWSRPDYRNVDVLQTDINLYMDACDDAKHLPSITGLCCWLDIDEHTLMDWESARARTRDGSSMEHYQPRAVAIKAAKKRILTAWTNRLQAQGQAAGAIFYLKNAFGWRDVQEIDIRQTVVHLSDAELASRIIEASSDLQALLPSPPAADLELVPSRMQATDCVEAVTLRGHLSDP